jgi:tetratricopeptide (TPR) repeat protein
VRSRLAIAGLAALALWLAPGTRAHDGVHEQIEEATHRIERDPGNGALYLARGELHRLHGDWPRALGDFDQAARLAPSLAAVDFARGRALLEAGRPAEAIAPLDRFLVGEPAHVDALVARARARDACGDHRGAAADFTRAISSAARPEPEYYVERARALDAAGAALDAIRGLDEGISRLGPVVSLELCAVDVERKAGLADAAVARIDRIAARSPRKESWLARRGEILEEAGRTREARAAYRAALDALRALPSRLRSRSIVELETHLIERLERSRR